MRTNEEERQLECIAELFAKIGEIEAILNEEGLHSSELLKSPYAQRFTAIVLRYIQHNSFGNGALLLRKLAEESRRYQEKTQFIAAQIGESDFQNPADEYTFTDSQRRGKAMGDVSRTISVDEIAGVVSQNLEPRQFSISPTPTKSSSGADTIPADYFAKKSPDRTTTPGRTTIQGSLVDKMFNSKN